MASRATTTEPATNRRTRSRGGWVASGLLAVSLPLLAVWFVWRLSTLGPHPLKVALLLMELSGWTGGVLVARGLITARAPRVALRSDGTYRYAVAVADRVGRTRATDLRHDLRSATDRIVSRRVATQADRAMIGVMVDGPRRIALVASLAGCLLLGVAPFPKPPIWALASVAAGSLALALTHRIGSAGRIKLGDRTRWSFATLGEVLAPADRRDLAPRRWVGTVGTIVVLNVCVALRGISDRWTHGLPEMTADGRLVTMGWASLVVVGGLYALRTIPTPRLDNAHLVARRLEERTARQSALGAAVCIGLIGLVAGVMPVDDDESGETEPTQQIDADGEPDG